MVSGCLLYTSVIIYAKEYHKSDEELLRALLVSNLIAIHIKTGIGPLSAFCGAVTVSYTHLDVYKRQVD